MSSIPPTRAGTGSIPFSFERVGARWQMLRCAGTLASTEKKTRFSDYINAVPLDHLMQRAVEIYRERLQIREMAKNYPGMVASEGLQMAWML